MDLTLVEFLAVLGETFRVGHGYSTHRAYSKELNQNTSVMRSCRSRSIIDRSRGGLESNSISSRGDFVQLEIRESHMDLGQNQRPWLTTKNEQNTGQPTRAWGCRF